MPTVRRIIIGVHGSLGSLQALRFAADEARQRNVPLLAVTAWIPPGGIHAVTASSGTFRCLASSAANRSACRLPRDPCTPTMIRRTVGTVLASRTTPGAMT